MSPDERTKMSNASTYAAMRPPTPEEMATPEYRRNMLEIKLSLWTARIGHNPDAERAVADIKSKLAAL